MVVAVTGSMKPNRAIATCILLPIVVAALAVGVHIAINSSVKTCTIVGVAQVMWRAMNDQIPPMAQVLQMSTQARIDCCADLVVRIHGGDPEWMIPRLNALREIMAVADKTIKTYPRQDTWNLWMRSLIEQFEHVNQGNFGELAWVLEQQQYSEYHDDVHRWLLVFKTWFDATTPYDASNAFAPVGPRAVRVNPVCFNQYEDKCRRKMRDEVLRASRDLRLRMEEILIRPERIVQVAE